MELSKRLRAVADVYKRQIIFLVVSKTKITNPIWNAEVSELADEQD